MDALALSTRDAENLDRSILGGTEPVRNLRVELGHLARAHRHVMAAEQQPQLARPHVQPHIALVRAQLRLTTLGRNDPSTRAYPVVGE